MKFYLSELTGEPGLLARISTLALFGADAFEKYPKLVEIATERSFYKGSTNLGFLIMAFKAVFHIKRYMDIMQEICDKLSTQFSPENIGKLTSSSDIWSLIERGIEDYEKTSNSHSRASFNSVINQLIVFSIVARGSDKFTMQHQNDIALLLGSMNNVESANIPEMIAEIAGKIVEMNKQEQFLKVDSKKAVAWLEENCISVYELFQAFMKRHGHRSINELDFISKSWSMEPEKIIDMIKSNLNQADGGAGVPSKVLSSDEIIEKLKTPLDKVSKFIIRKILPKCQQSVQTREKAKSMLVFATNEIRKAAIYLGKVMVNEGFLPDKELIFHLSAKEIKNLIATRDGKLIAKAVRRQKLSTRLNELKFPELSFGIPLPVSFNQSNDKPASKGDVLVQGVPVCGGVVTGRACVCKSFADVNMIQKGDILITFGTDIGWSPYFPILGGVCTEIGGLISHGAVVAREYGLPCIISANFATYKVKHGQVITMNADDGTIIAAK